MKRFFGFFSSFMLLAVTAIGAEYYVEVPYHGRDDIKKLVEQGFDVGGINLEKHSATIIVKEADMKKTRALRVLSQREITRPDQGYKTPEEVEKTLAAIEAKYPQLAKVEVIGKSTEGRSIFAINITSRFSTATKPTVMFDAMHHAREVMTSEVGLDIADYLTSNYDTDEKVRKWVNAYSIWVVPMVNPDGNNKVWTSEAMWRKNTQGGYGVDVNRNYPFAWNTCNGSSGSKSSETYRGASAGSEPETQAIMNLASRIKPKFDISYHSYSEIVIYPYGCSPQKISKPDADIYIPIGKELAARLKRDSGSGSYEPGTSYELLYNVDGGSIDWMYEKEKIMAFVIEMNSDSLGFQPSYAKWRDDTVKRQREGWQYILDKMEGPGIR